MRQSPTCRGFGRIKSNPEGLWDAQIQAAINKQVGLELYSAYTYLAMSAHLAEQKFEGFAHWMRLQAQEELAHAMRFHDYVVERGGHVQLPAIDAPPADFGSPLDVFESALAQEKHVTAEIHAIYGMARDKKDYATELHLQWFVTEQVEEENAAGLAVEQLKRAGSDTSVLLMLDHQFGGRAGE